MQQSERSRPVPCRHFAVSIGKHSTCGLSVPGENNWTVIPPLFPGKPLNNISTLHVLKGFPVSVLESTQCINHKQLNHSACPPKTYQNHENCLIHFINNYLVVYNSLPVANNHDRAVEF